MLVVAPGQRARFFNKVDPRKGPLDAELSPRTLENIPPKQIVLGRVVDADKKPVANVVVSVAGTQIGNTTHGRPPEGTDPLDVTDENGEFLIGSPRAFDSMNLKVEARGFARRNFNETRPGPKRHEMMITEGASLTGRVLNDGKPVKDVALGVVSVDRTIGNFTGDFQIATRENGKFLFVNLPPDREYQIYGVMDSLKEFGALPARRIRVEGDGSMKNMGDLIIVPGRRLAGQVKLADEKPIPEHTRLVIGRRDAWDSTAIELPADGAFDLRNLPPESLSVRASLKGYRHSARNASLDLLNPFGLAGRLDADKTDLTILLEPGDNLPSDYTSLSEEERPENLPLLGIEGTRPDAHPWIVTGRVVDAETKAPLPQFRITPGRKPDPRGTRTEWQESRAAEFTDGTFRVELPSKRGFVVLMAEAEGYLPAVSDPLATNQTTWDFELKTGAGPRGVLLQSDGKPAAGVTVVCLSAQEQAGLRADGRIVLYGRGNKTQTLTDPEGWFDFPPKPGAGEIVAVGASGFARISTDELASKGQFTLQPWGRVTGRLVQDGKPIADENVDLRWPGGLAPGRPWINLPGTRTDDDGRFILEHVPPGELEITTRIRMSEGFGGWTSHAQKKFIVRPGEETDLGTIHKTDPPSHRR